MEDRLEKLLALPVLAKLGILAGILLLVAGGYYYLYYSDMMDEKARTTADITRLAEEKKSYEKRKKEYVAYREELHKLQEEQRELLKALPKRAEIPTFISNIQEQADLSGVEVVNTKIENEVPEELYIKIPVSLEVRGGYHAITKFFKNVAELRRIVNIENLAISVESKADEQGPPKLRARFVAATFRYVEKGGGS